MTGIASNEAFVAVLDGDLQWRKVEIEQLRRLLDTDNAEIRTTLSRAAIVLLYAHWEGYIKRLSQAFIELIASQCQNFGELRREFCLIGIERHLSRLQGGDRSWRVLMEILGHMAELDRSDVAALRNYSVNTKSNLRFEVLIDICQRLALDHAGFAAERDFINRIICDRRNYVAHGEELDLDKADFKEMSERLLAIMLSFRNLLEDAAVNRTYLRASAAA